MYSGGQSKGMFYGHRTKEVHLYQPRARPTPPSRPCPGQQSSRARQG